MNDEKSIIKNSIYYKLLRNNIKFSVEKEFFHFNFVAVVVDVCGWNKKKETNKAHSCSHYLLYVWTPGIWNCGKLFYVLEFMFKVHTYTYMITKSTTTATAKQKTSNP